MVDQFGFYPVQWVGNPDLKPEESLGWDIGIEQAFWSDLAVVDVTYFRQNLRKEFISPTFITAINPSGTSRRQGTEDTASLHPAEALASGLRHNLLHATHAGWPVG